MGYTMQTLLSTTLNSFLNQLTDYRLHKLLTLHTRAVHDSSSMTFH